MTVSIQGFFAAPDAVDLDRLSAWLDDLGDERRVAEVRSLSRREQAALFEAAKGYRAITLDDLVPASTPALAPVIHHGCNSLPAFRLFEKRFCRPPNSVGALWGYNEQPFRAVTGPGYFVARPSSTTEVCIDYTELPAGKPADWPRILPNSARLSRFIYHRTRDFLRGVSRHVSIGRATREGHDMDNWFVLCRKGP